MAEPTDRAALPTDGNHKVIFGGVSSDDGFTPIPVEVDPATGRLLVDPGSSGGGDASATNQLTTHGLIGAVNETAPASDTASSGLNGRLQRIAQRITSLMALLPGSLGQKARAASLAVTLSTEDITALTPPAAITGFATSALQSTGNTSMANIEAATFGVEYETVAASATAQVLGATGATGDLIKGVLIIPATTSPGSVTLLDNATSITIFTGGASSVSNLVPFMVPLGIKSVSGAWKITTSTNVSCIAVGNFT
jgi:hypothetical protein